MKINNFRGDLTDISAKKEALEAGDISTEADAWAVSPRNLVTSTARMCTNVSTKPTWTTVQPCNLSYTLRFTIA